jgi:streptogramin lyase
MKPNRLITLAVTAGIAAATLSAAGCSKTSPGTTASTTLSGTATHTTISALPHQVSYSPQVVLPFGQYINHLAGVAVDTAGNVYVLDSYYGQLWKLAPGASTLTTPVITGLYRPFHVAVDTFGNLYVTDEFKKRC